MTTKRPDRDREPAMVNVTLPKDKPSGLTRGDSYLIPDGPIQTRDLATISSCLDALFELRLPLPRKRDKRVSAHMLRLTLFATVSFDWQLGATSKEIGNRSGIERRTTERSLNLLVRTGIVREFPSSKPRRFAVATEIFPPL